MISFALQGNIPLGSIIHDGHYPAANVAATKTLAAISNGRNAIVKVTWSYSAAPTGGRLLIEDGAGNEILDVDIISGGPGSLNLVESGSRNTAMIITLAAGGGVVIGKLNFDYVKVIGQ